INNGFFAQNKKLPAFFTIFAFFMSVLFAGFAISNSAFSYANDSSTVKTKYEPIMVSSQITDPNNLLASDKPQIISAFQKAYDQSDIKIYCVFVPDFSNPDDPDAWIQATGALSNLDSKSVLFAVATQSGKTAIFIPKDSENLSKRNLETVSPSVVQLLSASQWSQAVIEFTKEITAQADANSLPPVIIVIIVLLGLSIIAGALYIFIFRKKLQKASDKPKRLKKIETVAKI
ncbi:MAG: TPM domain-containing protein, partial [Bifidobacteriaceae bacterium]|nr:TPM domain-containing protein [Bifidobacteriaceae bacterium]